MRLSTGCRLEATADVLCAVLLGNVSVVGTEAGFDGSQLATTTVGQQSRGADLTTAGIINGSVTVRFGYETTSGSSCNAWWSPCNATSSSPSCLQLYQAALDNVVLCSNDPQYLTVSSSGSSLDFGYMVRVGG